MTSICLTGCFNSNDTLEKYKTPELFLSHSIEPDNYITIYSSKDSSKKTLDYNLDIKNAILDAGPFTNTSSFKPNTDRYFTYDILRSLSTAGPNECKMRIYDDGYISIYAKDALANASYSYYTMDNEKAYSLNDFVEEKILDAENAKKEAEEQAKVEGTIDNFFIEMEKRSSITIMYWPGDTFFSDDYHDNGELLAVLKQAAYTPCERLDIGSRVLSYNDQRHDYGDDYLTWRYELSKDNTKVELTYEYKDRNNQSYVYYFYYTIEESQGIAIINKASEVASKNK